MLSFLPIRLLYLFSNLCFIILHHVVGYRKKIVKQNLSNAFSDKTVQERKQIEKNFYSHLCDLLVEHIKALTISPHELLRYTSIDNREILESFYSHGRSIILVSGHFGNWEWVAHALALQTSYVICSGYQELKNKSVDRLAMNLRTRFKRKVMKHTSLFRHIIMHNGAPQAVALLIDQAPQCKKNSYWTTFLDQSTAVILTAAKLAQKCNQPIFYIKINQIKRGRYQATPILLTAYPTRLSTQEIAELYTRKLEEDIVSNPSFWLWSHRRWK
ncbi:lysophospholipid acyltransferase family protein [Cardinium endosymbiont of Tipula unca]|uniref:lysophospholipid acyltransferase family protein n=1 Tax=Cardinium endosymbiont of Tipula unca TaxID=3066216 RepID=UPI0030CBC6B9